MGIAVDTERGLLVPVVRDAHAKSVQADRRGVGRADRAGTRGQGDADDLRGGTFTITNLGMYDIDAFTPIINLPECAILGVGRIVARPVVIDEEHRRDRRPQDDGAEPDLRPPPGRRRAGGAVPPAHQALGRAALWLADIITK